MVDLQHPDYLEVQKIRVSYDAQLSENLGAYAHVHARKIWTRLLQIDLWVSTYSDVWKWVLRDQIYMHLSIAGDTPYMCLE